MRHQTAPTNPYTALATAIAALWLAYAPSQADARPTYTGKEVQLTITGAAQTFGIGLLQDGDVRVNLPSGISHISIQRNGPLIYQRKAPTDKNTVYLRFKTGSAVGTVASARLESFKGFEVRLDVEKVGAREAATADITVMHITEVELERARIVDADAEHSLEEEKRDALRRLERTEGFPVMDSSRSRGGPISVRVHRAEWEHDRMYVYFTAYSHVAQPRKVGAVAALDKRGRPIAGTRVYFENDDRRSPGSKVTSLAPGIRPVDMLLDGGGQEQGLIVIPAASEADRDMFGIRLYGTDQAMLTESILQAWWLTPVTQEQWERQQRAKQTTVSVRLLGGGFWTGAGDELGGLEATTLAGLGVRIQRGYGNGFAMEGDLFAAKSGEARFNDMAWNGSTGTVTRNAAIGRATGGVAMRFGYDYLFTGRAGLGLQVAGYDSMFDMGGSPIAGPGDGLDIDGVWSVGMGFDARLGGSWSLGAVVNFAVAFKSEVRSLEVGLNIGYGWN